MNDKNAAIDLRSEPSVEKQTERYLKELLRGKLPVEAIGIDQSFDELGLDSIAALELIIELDNHFGELSQMLLFEYDSVRALSRYFIKEHRDSLVRLLETMACQQPVTRVDRTHQPGRIDVSVAVKDQGEMPQSVVDVNRRQEPSRTDQSPSAPLFIRKDQLATVRSEQQLIVELGRRYEKESGYNFKVSMPYVFFDSQRQAYVHADCQRGSLLAFNYVGPVKQFERLTKELLDYSRRHSLNLNLIADTPIQSVGDHTFTATPFMVMQRINNLQSFNLQGNRMRRLRYLVAKFQRMGSTRTEEYRVGSDARTDQAVVRVIDQWIDHKRKQRLVGAAIQRALEDIVTARIDCQTHRLFLTYLDDVLLNVIIISALPSFNGYFLDLEFYPDSMPLGAMDFAICKVIETLASEGRTTFSLGGTPNVSIMVPDKIDRPLADQLKRLHDDGVLNDDGNFKFKNKFRPTNTQCYLIRPSEAEPWDVLECISILWPSSKALAKRQASSGKAETGMIEGDVKHLEQADDSDTATQQAEEITHWKADGTRTSQRLAESVNTFCERNLLGKQHRQALIEYVDLLPTVDFGAEPSHTMIEYESGTTLEVFHWGDDGTPLLMIPGFGVTAPIYHRLIRRLCRKHRVIVAHAPGVGMSRVDENTSLSLDNVAKSFRAVLERMRVQTPVHVIGSSWGGLVAQTFAARFGSSVASLVLLQTTDQIRNNAPEVINDEIKGNFDDLVTAASSSPIEQRRYRDDHRFLLRTLVFDRKMTSQYLRKDNVSTTSLLDQIAVPTLVVTGENDTMIPPERSKTLYQRISNASHCEIQRARHFAELTHCDEVYQAITRFTEGRGLSVCSGGASRIDSTHFETGTTE